MRRLAMAKTVMLIMVVSLCWMHSAVAETVTVSVPPGGGSLDAAAHLNFRINIPKFIIFTVGTAGVGNVDTVVFDPAVADVAAGNPGTVATAGSGTVAVSLISNGGAVSITDTNDGGGNGLSDGGTNYISYAQIITASSGNIPAPVLSNAGGDTVTVPTAGAITNESGQWTYTYNNPATPPVPGIYTGQVTYTASVP